MRIVILGAGAQGMLYGARMIEEGYDVTFVSRHLEELKKEGLRVTTPDKGERVLQVNAVEAAGLAGSYDVVFVFTKTTDTAAALGSIRHILDDRVTLVSLQNGLLNEKRLAEFVAMQQVCIGCTVVPADRKNYHTVVSGRNGYCAVVGGDGTVTERARNVAYVLNKSGLNCHVGEDTITMIWEKVAFNAAVFGVCSLCECYTGDAMAVSAAAVFAISDEVCRVANANDIPVSAQKVRDLITERSRTAATHVPSMVIDVMNGRPTEVDSVHGAVVQKAREAGVPAQVNEFVAEMIRIKSAVSEKRFRV